MKVIAELSVVPLGTGASISSYVAACERVIRDAGIVHQLHANGTNLEGEWDEILHVVRRCHDVVHEMGAPRVLTQLKLSTRNDREETLAERVESVEEKVPGEPGPRAAAGFAEVELRRVGAVA